MTIIVFLIDTSGSMNQRTHFGARPSLLDVAKDAVEKFLKLRQRDAASRGDRYMLLTFEDSPNNVKAGWKESHAVFINELKNLSATGMTTLGPALKNAFDLLNINRMQTGIDTYGQGRCPFFLEPSVIIVITDGGKMGNTSGVHEELNLPMHSSVPGSELTKEPFRWDQRLFSIVLRLTGTYNSPNDNINSLNNNFSVPSDESPINAMCDVTGGRSYCVTSQRTLMASLDQLIQRIHGGVVINFEKVGPDPPVIIPNEDELLNNSESNKESFASNSMNGLINISNNNNSNNLSNSNNNINDMNVGTKSWHSTRKLIYVQRSAQKGYSVGHWPIPESFWPDLSCPSLQPRTAHPIVKFTCANSEPAVIENLPFDKYELEPSPLTQFILTRKQPSVAWQVFVSNSHKNSELGLPFGYLKASTNLTCVNLFVLPYNYPVLLPLLDDLFKIHQGKPTREWKVQFDNYLKMMPLYYASPLKRALQRMGAPNLVPDNMENCLSYPVLNYLKRLKNTAKAEYEKLVASVGMTKPQVICEGVRVLNNASNMRKISEHGLCSNPLLSQRFANLKNELNEFSGFVIRFRNNHLVGSKTQCYRNAFDISRHELLDQIFRMRTNFLQKHTSSIRYQDEDQIHSLPISQMGNYQEYLKRMPLPLRELESTPVRQHMFGNPFKIDKRGMMMIDEADIDLVGNGSGGSSPVRMNKRSANDIYMGGPKPKRKPGPLPKDFPLQRPCSPSPPPALPLSQPLSPLLPSVSPLLPPLSPLSPPLSPIFTNPLPSSSLQTTTPPLKETVKSVANGNLSAVRNKDLTSQTVPNNLLTNSETSKVVIIPPKTWAKDSAPERTNSVVIPNSSQLPNTVCVSNEQTIDSEVKLNNHIDRENEIELISELTPKPEVEFSSINNLNVNNSSLSIRNVNSRTNAPTYMPVNGRIVNSDSSQSSTLTNHVDHNGTDNNLNNKRLQFTAEEFELKRYLFKLVRKPGRNFDELLSELSHIKGSLGDYLLQEVIAEANRFKRKSLIQVLSTQFGRSHDISGLESLRTD